MRGNSLEGSLAEVGRFTLGTARDRGKEDPLVSSNAGMVRGLTDSLLLVDVCMAVWGRVGLFCADASSPLTLGVAENRPISSGLVREEHVS